MRVRFHSICLGTAVAALMTGWQTVEAQQPPSPVYGVGVNSDAGLTGTVVFRERQLRLPMNGEQLTPADKSPHAAQRAVQTEVAIQKAKDRIELAARALRESKEDESIRRALYQLEQAAKAMRVLVAIPSQAEAEVKLRQAFGEDSDILTSPVRALLTTSKEFVLAASSVEIQPDGRVKVQPCRVAAFTKDSRITTCRATAVVLTFDAPIRTLADMANRKSVKMEFAKPVTIEQFSGVAPRQAREANPLPNSGP
jgi:hypothetical protein